MRLKNHVTEPSIRSRLKFTEKEVKTALTEYAEQKGYRFNHYNVIIRYPTVAGIDDFNDPVTLIIDQPGTEPGIEYTGD